MIDRGIPIHVVQLIAYWYQTQELQVRWGNSLSDKFKVTNGIRQGGILSPYLFNLILDNLSKELNLAKVGCHAGSILINHLSYADDMLLIAPSAKGLQKLLSICSSFAIKNDIVYNTEKTKCMIFWPRVYIKEKVKIFLQGEQLSFVDEFKYLGVVIVSNLSDDVEMGKRVRSIYAAGNTLISNFRKCDESTKILMFKTYCYNVYGMSLWSSYRVTSHARIKIAHNDIFRTLMNVPRFDSASSLFVQKGVNNMDVLLRNSMYSLMDRLLCSSNSLVEALCNSEVRVHSKIWQRWAIALGVEWEVIMRY